MIFALDEGRLNSFAFGDILLERAVGLLELEGFFLQFMDEDFVIFLIQIGFFKIGRVHRRKFAALGFRHYLVDPVKKRFRFGGFEDKVVRSQIQSEPFIFWIGIGGGVDDEGNGLQASIRFPVAQERVAVHHRHEQIRDDQVRRVLPRQDQGFGAMVGGNHLETVALQESAQKVEILLLVVDNQNSGHFHGGSSFPRGFQVAFDFGHERIRVDRLFDIPVAAGRRWFFPGRPAWRTR